MEIVILAAGEGRRLRSQTAKPLLPLAEKPLLAHVLHTASTLKPTRIIVVCPPRQQFKDAVAVIAAAAGGNKLILAEQPVARGTADALRCALPHLSKTATALVLCADTPLLTAATLRRLCKHAAQQLALLTFITDTPTGYGRIVRDGNAVRRIVEHRDATAAERAIKEVYAGVMAAPAAHLGKLLARIGDDNAAGERYLTDIAALANADGIAVSATTADEDECAGVNTAADLERLTAMLRRRRAAALMARGVRLADASRIDVRGDLRCGDDVDIDINVIFEGTVKLGRGVCIGANCILRDCSIGDSSIIKPFSHIEQATIGARCAIGPYARLRPGSALAADVRVGNFVEVKNSRLAAGAKAGHLAYIGDSSVGARSNIGAGVITCNYDGSKKHRTEIGSDVFIGSDSQLVAPVKIANGAYVAAGATITKNVAADTLAISRSPQNTRRLKRRGA